jgi:hypothetical protein
MLIVFAGGEVIVFADNVSIWACPASAPRGLRLPKLQRRQVGLSAVLLGRSREGARPVGCRLNPSRKIAQ